MYTRSTIQNKNMLTLREISDTKLLLILTGLLGVFLYGLTYPLKLHAQQNTREENSQKAQEQSKKSNLEKRILRVQKSIKVKDAAISYLNQSLAQKEKRKRLSAPELKLVKIASENFKEQTEMLRQQQKAYLEYLKQETTEISEDTKIIESFKKNIYKYQQGVYYSFWETHNLME